MSQETPRILEEVRERLAEITPELYGRAEPEEELAENEREVGVLSEYGRRLFYLAADLRRELGMLMVNFSLCGHEEKAAQRTKILRSRALVGVANELLWLQAKDEGLFWGCEEGCVGVRAGWKICVFNDEPKLPSALRAILAFSSEQRVPSDTIPNPERVPAGAHEQ